MVQPLKKQFGGHFADAPPFLRTAGQMSASAFDLAADTLQSHRR